MSTEASGAEILEKLCLEYAQMLLQPKSSSKGPDNAVDEVIETIFSRLDDVTALADSARVDADQLTGAVLPALVAHGEMLDDVFRSIDRIESCVLRRLQAFVDRAHASAQAFSKHAEALQAVYDAKNPKAMTRMMRAFTKKPQAVEVPEWDPEPFLFNTTEVFDAMRREAGLPVSQAPSAPVEAEEKPSP